jgi:3,4-dihydroxy 2-butanone 4-phosphate synthase/GTP cyclohydrolase II
MTDPIERVRQAIDDYRDGKMVILVDDEDRENEGDLCLAAEKVTPEAINFMAMYGRGLICLALTEPQIDKLELPMMVRDNQAALGTAFTVSIEAREGVTTGISAKDRATTIEAAIRPDVKPRDLVSPGHVFPLKARRGGVLVRTGQTEGSVDLARLAGLEPASVICEIMRDDGEMARMPDLEKFAAEHGVRILSIADLITFRLQKEKIVELKSTGTMRPGVLGSGKAFAAHLYGAEVEDTEYLALVRGDVRKASSEGKSVLVRVQSMCPIGDPFAVRPELADALAAIEKEDLGVFLYVFNRQRTSFQNSFGKQLQQRVKSEPIPLGQQSEALRDFGLGAQVLADIGCHKIRLLSNSDRKIVGIQGFGIEVTDRTPIPSRTGGKPGKLVSIEGGKEES